MTDSPPVGQTWHLAKNSQEEYLFTEFEFALWRVYFKFTAWQESCQLYICENDKLTAHEIALLHVMRLGNERPKSVYEIGSLLNREDHHSIRYGIKKLIDMGYVQQVKPGAHSKKDKKTSCYKITKAGRENTETYTQARQAILIDLLKEYPEVIKELDQITKSLRTLAGIYDEAERRAAVRSGMDMPDQKSK